MLFVRRLPGFFYYHRFTIVSCLFVLLTLFYFLVRWNFICTNAQAWMHVKRMCELYTTGKAIGSVCAPLCTNNAITNINCHSFRSTKEAVFSGEWHKTKLVFKTAASEVRDLHWHDNGVKKYPTEVEFMSTIRAIVRNKFNITISKDTAQRLSRLKPLYIETDVKKRQLELENIWMLIQDNEYLLSAIFSERDIFPQLLGTCGPYFAVEYLDPVHGLATFSSYEDNKEEWAIRLRVAIQIVELIEELENSFQEPFHLCDIKLEHFGVVKEGSRMKFIDLVGVYPRSAINTIIKELNSCHVDDDCEFFDCRSTCDMKTHRCSNQVTNSNLQIVCEKIFLGWRMSNTVMIPGLLMTPHTPAELASILRQCANPSSDFGKSRMAPDEEIKKRLYNILIEIEQSVTNDVYMS